MRQLIVEVQRGRGREVLEIAKRHHGVNLACIPAEDDGPRDLVLMNVSNERVEELVDDLNKIQNVRLTLLPRGVLTLYPPDDEAPQQAVDVTFRSPIEIFLSSLQSIGSWRGFLGYAAAAGAVVWIGLYTNTIYLLTAAMLIAPFAGPAMNLAIGTARGDLTLIWRNLLRYFSSILTTVIVAYVFSLVVGQRVATGQMVSAVSISSVAVVLPLVAGAAGALNLIQSERSSLVSGAATGMLVAASLAPPAGTIGMATAVQEWGMVRGGVFLLLLQLVGINLSAAGVFYLAGLRPRGVRYSRGNSWVAALSAFSTACALVVMLVWQFWSQPDFQRSTRAQKAYAEIQTVVNDSGLAKLVEANVRFTRADIAGQNTLLATVFVQSAENADEAAVRQELTRVIQRRLLEAGFNVTPLIEVSVLQPPD